MMAKVRNIGDISKYNVIRNYPLLKPHFDGVIVRIGYRGYSAGVIKEDARFREHMKGLTENKIPYGFYFMSQAVTESEAIAEAEYCFEMTKDYDPAYPTYYDSELSNPKGNGRADKLSAMERTGIAITFCQRLEELGRRAGVYASKSWFEKKLYATDLEKYSIWVAQYNSACNYKLTSYDMWQHTSSYQIAGLDTKFDRSYCYVEFAAGMEGAEKTASEDRLALSGECIPTASGMMQQNGFLLMAGKRTSFWANSDAGMAAVKSFWISNWWNFCRKSETISGKLYRLPALTGRRPITGASTAPHLPII